MRSPFGNPLFYLLFLPLCLAWGYVSFYFARSWWSRRNIVSLMLAFMPLGYVVAALRELHVLNRLSVEILYCASLTIGGLTAWVCHHNSTMRGPHR